MNRGVKMTTAGHFKLYILYSSLRHGTVCLVICHEDTEGYTRYTLALSIHDPGVRRRVDAQRHAPTTSPGERASSCCTGGWVGLAASQDGYEKSRHCRTSNLGPSTELQVATPTTLVVTPYLYLPEIIHQHPTKKNTERLRSLLNSLVWSCTFT